MKAKVHQMSEANPILLRVGANFKLPRVNRIGQASFWSGAFVMWSIKVRKSKRFVYLCLVFHLSAGFLHPRPDEGSPA